MRELTASETEAVNGAILVNLGMGMAGATGSMAVYALAGGIGGNLSGSGFISAGVGGFVYGIGGFNGASAYAGAAASGVTTAMLKEDDS